jgi:ABC-type sugar transport system ATPase subunit
VQNIERLGAFSIVTVKAGPDTFKAIVRGAVEFDIDKAVKLKIEKSAILVFDNEGRGVR